MSDKPTNPHWGSPLDDFLDEEGIREEATTAAIKRVIAWQLAEEMKRRNITKARLADLMHTSRAQVNRILDPEKGNVTIETLRRAAHLLGREVELQFKDGEATRPQGYVSSELCHFVGGKSKDPEVEYDLLVNKILKAGWLTYAPHDHAKPRTASLDFSKPISTDETIKYQVICFCDIPETELSIHTDKYGKFGLAFKKGFLIEKGACPVFYVAKESPVPEFTIFGPDDFSKRIKEAQQKHVIDRALYFDTSVRAILDILAAFDALSSSSENDRYMKGIAIGDCKMRLAKLLALNEIQITAIEFGLKGNQQANQTIRLCTNFLLNYVFTFMKCFDAKRQFHDPDNFYMEREWRLGANLNFALDDVARVFLPQEYAKRFRNDMPTYAGQVTFID